MQGDHLSKNYHFDDDMASFDKTIIKILQKLHFCRNVLKFVLAFIPSFDDNISDTKNKVDEITSNPRQIFYNC